MYASGEPVLWVILPLRSVIIPSSTVHRSSCPFTPSLPFTPPARNLVHVPSSSDPRLIAENETLRSRNLLLENKSLSAGNVLQGRDFSPETQGQREGQSEGQKENAFHPSLSASFAPSLPSPLPFNVPVRESSPSPRLVAQLKRTIHEKEAFRQVTSPHLMRLGAIACRY